MILFFLTDCPFHVFSDEIERKEMDPPLHPLHSLILVRQIVVYSCREASVVAFFLPKRFLHLLLLLTIHVPPLLSFTGIIFHEKKERK